MGITVIIPAYNAERYLEQTVQGVLAQTVSDWELVIVDDGSADGTALVAQSYAKPDPRIRVVRQANHGIAAARNRGLAESDTSCEFVIFLDHDDLWERDALELLREELRAHPGAAAANGLNRAT
jgi:CDP-glycerol glycerophosphotransferase